MFLYDFATKTAQKPDTVATYIRRNEKIFKNHVERREKQLWLDEKAVKILLKKYPEVQRKKYPWWKNETEFEEAMVNAIKGLWDNQEILRKELDGILTAIAELQDAMDQKEPQKENNGLISLEELFGEESRSSSVSAVLYSLIACSYSLSMYSLSTLVIFFSFLALFSTALEFLFNGKFDTGYLSASLNWLKFNVYISQFIDF